MNPILYESTETKFDTNGLGVLSDAISCIVTEERNGSFELTMQYSVEGIHYADIADRSIILAKPSPTDNPQPFRVYRHTKPLNGIVTFYARHISYDLSGTPVGPFTATNVIDALNKLKTNAVIPCPFEFWTDKVTAASMNVRVPSDIFALLGGQQGSVLDVYGGEYKFDGYTVRLYNERGTDRGVSIRYGKNLLDLEQEKNCANVCTGVYPYWVDNNGENLVQLSEKIVSAPGTYDFVRIKMLDLSSEWEEAPSTEQLKARAETYIKENNIGVPTISLTVSHAMLENTEEYKGQALLERIDLCDTARIEFPKLGVSASAKAVKTEFNALLNRYESITFGDARYTLADNTVDQKKALEESSNKASGLVAEAMKKLNEIVQNASGLYTTEEVQPDRSVIYYYHDKPTLNESKNVIKFTADAIGLSTDGGKTYPFGFTVTGDMVANILSAIGVNANWINAGILQSMPDENGERNFTFDLQSGEATVKNLSIHGQTVDDIAQGKADGALESAKGYADSAVNNFVSSVYNPRIAELQKQLDGQIESYFYDYEPALDNVPASNWKTETDRQKHEGDLFYWKSKGYAYRFFKDGNTWKWQMVQDTDVTKALEEAANAQHTADGKSRTFIAEPVTPYDKGDQWYRGIDNSTLVCTNSRQSGAFDMSDWAKLDNYADGKETIYSVQAQYYLSTSETSLSGGNWSNSQPEWTQGKYIWSRQYVTYGDGHHAYTPSETGVCITGNTGAKGDKGAAGTSVTIKSTSITYQASNSGTTTPTGSWSGTVPPVSNGQYLWTKTTVTYSDGTSTTAYSVAYKGTNGTNGKDGANGVGIKSITNYYLAYASASGVTTDTAGWGTSVQSVSAAKPYLWNYEVTAYTDGSSTAVEPHVVGTYGRDGTNGTAGKGISSIKEHYLATNESSGVTTGTAGWTDALQQTNTTNRYLWNYETITYTDGSSSTVAPRIIGTHGATGANGTNGKDGAPGEDGVGIDAIVAEYYVSDSATELSGGSWSAAIPAVQTGKYIWFRQKITYTDGNVEYAGQYCMSKTMGDIAQERVDAQTQEYIFNKLTNNGDLQGIFMQEGILYVNAEYLRGKTIDLNLLRLLGTMCGLMQGEGATKTGVTTTGIVMYGNDLDVNDHANPPYLIVTNAGIRGQSDRASSFNMSGADFEIKGRLKVVKDDDGNNGEIDLSSTTIVGNMQELWHGTLTSGSSTIDSSVRDYFNSFSAYVVIGATASSGSRVSSVIPKKQMGNKFQIADESNYISFTLSSTAITVNARSSSGAIYAIYGIK